LKSFLFADRTFRKEKIQICPPTKGTFAFTPTHDINPSANPKELCKFIAGF
jgi:hypothetical protein